MFSQSTTVLTSLWESLQNLQIVINQLEYLKLNHTIECIWSINV